MQKPHPDIWFPGTGSPESVVWAATHGHPYMNLGALVDTTEWLRQVYIDTAREVGFQPGPEHFGYLLRCLVADTDEKAIELGRTSCGRLATASGAPQSTTTRPATSPAKPSE